MVFKRRNRRTYGEVARDFIYPKGGFRRAAQYVLHRMRRLPDAPHRIARGVFAGSLVSFTPLFGMHFLSAALLAWILRGNILAALLATFVGNPITFPIIAMTAIQLGHWMLGIEARMDFHTIVSAFGNAGAELWVNMFSPFTHHVAHWDNLIIFFKTIYLPYFVGGILPGLIISTGLYYLTLPLIIAYQKMRAAKARERSEKRHALRAKLAETAARMRAKAAESGDDDTPGAP